MLAQAFYTVLGLHGSDIPIWRDTLFLLLKKAVGQTCDNPWAKELDPNTLVVGGGQVDGISMQQLWCPGPDGVVQYDAADKTIAAQEEYLSNQRKYLETAKVEKLEKIARLAGQLRHVYEVLQSLSDLSSQQVQMLAEEKAEYERFFSKITNFLTGDNTKPIYEDALKKRRSCSSPGTTQLLYCLKLLRCWMNVSNCLNVIEIGQRRLVY
jgi:hypothetical protein